MNEKKKQQRAMRIENNKKKGGSLSHQITRVFKIHENFSFTRKQALPFMALFG
jgi:hypothetical protein